MMFDRVLRKNGIENANKARSFLTQIPIQPLRKRGIAGISSSRTRIFNWTVCKACLQFYDRDGDWKVIAKIFWLMNCCHLFPCKFDWWAVEKFASKLICKELKCGKSDLWPFSRTYSSKNFLKFSIKPKGKFIFKRSAESSLWYISEFLPWVSHR